jgi:hypothetical protein
MRAFDIRVSRPLPLLSAVITVPISWLNSILSK